MLLSYNLAISFCNIHSLKCYGQPSAYKEYEHGPISGRLLQHQRDARSRFILYKVLGSL